MHLHYKPIKNSLSFHVRFLFYYYKAKKAQQKKTKKKILQSTNQFASESVVRRSDKSSGERCKTCEEEKTSNFAK